MNETEGTAEKTSSADQGTTGDAFDAMLDESRREAAAAASQQSDSQSPAPGLPDPPREGSPPSPGAGGSVTPATAVPAVAAPPSISPEQLMALMVHQNQQRDQLFQQVVEQLKPKPTPETPRHPPRVDDALHDFRAPPRNAGESDAAYNTRSNAAAWDHVEGKRYSFMQEEIANARKAAVDEVRTSLRQEQQQRDEENRYVDTMQRTLKTAGLVGPAADLVSSVAHAELSSLHAQGQTKGWGTNHWERAMSGAVTRAKTQLDQARQIMAAAGVPGAPNLTLVPNAGPPVGAGSGGAGPGRAPGSRPTAPKTSDEAWGQVMDVVKEEQARGRAG